MSTMTVLTRSKPSLAVTDEQNAAAAAKIAEMTAAGKTNGARYTVVDGYNPGEVVPDSLVIRGFATLADAQEWGAFLTTIGSTDITYFNIVT